MKKTSVLLLLIAFGFISMTNKEKGELFKNESKLSSCKQDIPLTYSKKDNLIVAEKAKTLKDKELILLFLNKKTNIIYVTRYYLVSKNRADGSISNYLVEKSDYLKKENRAIFIKYSEKYNRFYLAECFDNIVSQDKELKELLKETN